MKIHYRDTSVLENMDEAISASIGTNQRIDYFEITGMEFRRHYTAFDKIGLPGGSTQYLYKGISIKVIE
jgi:hypothetical protein